MSKKEEYRDDLSPEKIIAATFKSMLTIDLFWYGRIAYYLRRLDTPEEIMALIEDEFCKVMIFRHDLLSQGRTKHETERQERLVLKDNRWLLALKFWKKMINSKNSQLPIPTEDNVWCAPLLERVTGAIALETHRIQ